VYGSQKESLMKKIVIVVLAAQILGACLPFTPTPGPTGPTVDISGTIQAGAQTSVAQTLTALPTITVAPVTDTATPPIALPTDTATTDPSTPTLVPSLTTTPGTATFTSTATLASAPGGATLIPTLTIRTYGTLPPAVPFSTVFLVNKARTEAYISLQVNTAQGGPTIIEYPVEGTIKILAPTGQYLYVAWVGGRKMVGNFRLKQTDELTITLFRDRVVIE
jgi:hypothetical protein